MSNQKIVQQLISFCLTERSAFVGGVVRDGVPVLPAADGLAMRTLAYDCRHNVDASRGPPPAPPLPVISVRAGSSSVAAGESGGVPSNG